MRYFLISDIHANYSALKAVEKRVKSLTPDGERPRYYFLGDLFGYGPGDDAIACFEWLLYKSHILDLEEPERSNWIPGNHDEWISNQVDTVNGTAHATLKNHVGRLQKENYFDEYQKLITPFLEISALRNRRKVYNQGKPNSLGLAFTHGSVTEVLQRRFYLYPWEPFTIVSDLERIAAENLSASTICLVYGHTHFQFLGHLNDKNIQPVSIKYGVPIRLENGYYAINPGSVGQPRDGDPRAAFALLDTDQMSITFYRTEYDVDSVVEALKNEQEKQILTREVVETLEKRLRYGDGGAQLLTYRAKVYAIPNFDLIAQSRGEVKNEM